MAWDGVPLIYMGDELGLLNDRSYADDPDRAADNRWLHRPVMDWRVAERRHRPETIEGRVFADLRRLVAARAVHPSSMRRPRWTSSTAATRASWRSPAATRPAT